MARKRKSGNKNRGQGHSAITRIGRPANPFARKRSRYSGKYLTLAIMGGAAFFVLKGCADDGRGVVMTQGQTTMATVPFPPR